MEILIVIAGLLIWGIIFGALGRLTVPGPNPMSIVATIAAGIGGSILGSVVGILLGARPNNSSWILFVFQVLGAALVVYLISRRRRGRVAL